LFGDGEVFERGIHVGVERFVIAIDGVEVCWWSPGGGCADTGDERGDDLVA
jgi:hypothetical protein